MAYQPSELAYSTDPFGMIQPGKPLTEEDVARAQGRLERLGLEDSMMGQANAWRGRMVAKRDDLLSGGGPVQDPNASALKEGAKSVVKSGLLSSL